MVDAITKAIENNQFGSIFIIGLVIFFTWLFKEQRLQYIEIREENTNETREVLVVYAQLYNELGCYNNINYEKIEGFYQRAIPFLPKESLKKYFKFKIDTNEESYNELKKDIENEIYSLKGLQRDTISYKQDNYLDTMEYLIYSTRLDIFFKPLMHTFTIFLASVGGILLFVSLLTKEIDYKVGVDLFTKFLSVLLLFVAFLFIMELVEKKKFKHTPFNWLVNVILFLSVIILVVLKVWYLGFFSVLVVSFYLYYLIKFGQRATSL